MTQFIIGKDQKDWKILVMEASNIKPTTLEDLSNDYIKSIKFKTMYLVQTQASQPYKNGKISKGKLVIDSATLEQNIKKNLKYLAVNLIYRKSDKNNWVGILSFNTITNQFEYISRRNLKQNYSQIINLTNNGVEFDLKEAQIEKIYINDLKFNVNNKVSYGGKVCMILDKDREKDYLIRVDNGDEFWCFENYLTTAENNKIKQKGDDNSQLEDITSKFKEIYASKGGIEVQKRDDYIIKVTAAEEGKTYYNKLEDAEYVGKAGQAVLIGTQGEEWLTKIEKVCSTYTTDAGKELIPDMISVGKYRTIKPKVNSDKCWAVKITDKDKYFIKTSWGSELKINTTKNKKGETIQHGAGDILLSYNAEGTDLSVINGLVFGKTYKKYKENNTEELKKSSEYSKLIDGINNKDFDKCITALEVLSDKNDKATLLSLINSSTDITNLEVKDAILNIITSLL